MKKQLLLLSLMGFLGSGVVQAQRYTDELDRGVVAIPVSQGNLVSWRKFGEEYYDTKYNLYRGDTKIASALEASNFVDASGNTASTYSVEPIVKGVVQARSAAVKAWSQKYLDVPVQPVVNRAGQTIGNSTTNGSSTTSGYIINDISLADVTGDGVAEFIVKRNNAQGNLLLASNTTDFNLYECYKIDGTRLWWIDLGPNLMAGPDEQWDMIGYDWDMDGKAEVVMRGADNMIIHTSTGKTINVGNMSYVAPRDEYTHQGKEYLIYLNGETGEPYLGWDGGSSWTPMDFPLPRFEQGEAADVLNATNAEYAAVWGDTDTGHRSLKIYMGAPYLDGRTPAIFFGRGCYTRHKMCALQVNPTTHELTQLWRWNCYDSKSPWFGNGFHNFAIADVDMDGRDEIMFGSMCIDDTGYGLSTTGLGHGDAQHCGDLDPYRWGLEQFNCLEGSEGNSYWNPTTGAVYYRKSDGGDDGRALAGNFSNNYPGGQGRSVSSGVIGLSSDKIINTNGDVMSGSYSNLNNRIYWDGDLLDEILNSTGGEGRPAAIMKWGGSRIWSSEGAVHNNSSKCNPSAQGDILGDWREEVVLRTSNNAAMRIFVTDYPTDYPLYTLWHDHVYRNGMCWQSVGYNQPPHTSFFLGELEGITIAPPPLLLRGRTEVANGGTIATTNDHLLIAGYEDKTISVTDGAAPYILTVNAPAWVQGTGAQQAVASTPKAPARTIIKYTTTLTGGAFSGATRLVKQGEGVLVLPNVTEKHTGKTDVWNGTLQFDGTMESSPVWLNRHTTLISDGGKFMGGLQVDYNATVYPGGQDHVGSITASTLTLGFGSRIVFDVSGTTMDQLQATTLVIETKDWSFGPKYKTPVFEFRGDVNSLAAGSYEIGTVSSVTGDVDDILIEGIDGKRYQLDIVDKKLYLVLEDMRDATVVTWNGTADNSIWDLAVTTNFQDESGQSVYAAAGDDIIFDDRGYGTVTVKGAVSPNSITFNNSASHPYVINGDSIKGGGTITKNGLGTATINTENRTGATTINEGTLIVNSLANLSGISYGALGDVSQKITINDGAILQVSQPVITDQPVTVSGTATLNVPSSLTLTLNKGMKGTGATVVKAGAGQLTLGTANTFSTLLIKAGTVASIHSSNIDQLPSTVEFQGGTLWGANMEDGAGVTNRADFVVPEGKTGTFYASFRGNYNGTLTGKGTFKVYTGGIRCYWNGDWSAFEGTIVPGRENRQNKKSYDPTFNITNTKGMPKATLQLDEGMSITNVDPANSSKYYSVEIGKITGSGTLEGSGTYYIGGNDADIIAEFSATSPVVKRGAGNMIAKTIGGITKTLTIEGGNLYFNDSKMETSFFGSSVTAKDSGAVIGRGMVPSVIMESGTLLAPRVVYGTSISNGGTLKVTAAATIKAGATLDMLIKRKTSYSVLNARFLTINGIVKVTLDESYEPAAGDSFTLWTATGSFSGTPTLDLPALPDGLYWDTSALLAKTGVLTITNDPAGVGRIAADAVVDCQVFTLSGTLLGTFTTTKGDVSVQLRRQGLASGTYVVKMSDRWRSEAQKILVK